MKIQEEKTMRLNEFARPDDDQLFSDEDRAKILDAALNGPWTEMTVEEAIAHNRKICSGEADA